MTVCHTYDLLAVKKVQKDFLKRHTQDQVVPFVHSRKSHWFELRLCLPDWSKSCGNAQSGILRITYDKSHEPACFNKNAIVILWKDVVLQ